MGKSIVFIHGAWVTPLCWEKFNSFFQAKGDTCLAPAWPHKDKSVEELRKNPPPELAGLGITEIVDHYAKIIKAQAEPPILIGHSFGGLFVQMLLDRGLGASGVAIDPAPPKGVLAFYPTVIRALFPVLSTIGGWNKILQPSFNSFVYAFIHTLPKVEQQAVFDRYVVPETGRPFFQAAVGLFSNTVRVNFNNASRAPLLLIAGANDLICPAPQIRSNYRKYKNSPARTHFKEFPDRTHWIIAQPGWEEVADYIDSWLGKLPAR